MKVSVTTSGLERLEEKITRRANFIGTNGVRDILRQSAKELEEHYKETIKSFTPGTVQDLKESTKKQKMRKHGRIYPILVGFGDLINSIKALVFKPVRGSGWGIRLMFQGANRQGVMNARVAEAHIEGQGNLPKRDFTKVPGWWRQKVLSRISQALRRL